MLNAGDALGNSNARQIFAVKKGVTRNSWLPLSGIVTLVKLLDPTKGHLTNGSYSVRDGVVAAFASRKGYQCRLYPC